MTDPHQTAAALSEARDYVNHGAHDALNRMKRAHERGTGCHLTADMLKDLYITIIGDIWSQDDPRAILE